MAMGPNRLPNNELEHWLKRARAAEAEVERLREEIGQYQMGAVKAEDYVRLREELGDALAEISVLRGLLDDRGVTPVEISDAINAHG